MAILDSRGRRFIAGPLPGLIGSRRSGWIAVAVTIAALVVAPVLAIVWIAAFPSESIWQHLTDTVLPDYIATTLILMAGVGLGVAVVGTGTAWLVAMCHFPGHRLFSWALILPMAMPAYVIAYTYTDLLEFAGPVQSALRVVFGWQTANDYAFPPIRSTGGAIVMLSLVLYPYVYLFARASFYEQSVCALEASRILGRGPVRSFVSVALPLARPAIVAGMTLALLESLNDYGTVDYFAVRTLTAGVFDIWFEMANAGAAAQIALVLLGFVIVLIWVERLSRRRLRFHQTSTRHRAPTGYALNGWLAVAATAACCVPVIAGFVLPAAVLGHYATLRFADTEILPYFGYAGNSLLLAGLAAFVTLLIGLVLAYAKRLCPGPVANVAARLACLGYAVPGVAIAIGIMIPMGAADNMLDAAMRTHFGIATGLAVSGTVMALVIAYVVRFLAISVNAAEVGLARVTPNIDMAARTLGHGPLATLRRVHLPLIRGSVLTGAVLVFVDTMKELPATLVLRPFNFDTLATYVYQYASDELLEDCAPAALIIVMAGIVPVILLNRMITLRKNRPASPNSTSA